MKRQYIVLLSVVLLTYPPLCLGGKTGGQRKTEARKQQRETKQQQMFIATYEMNPAIQVLPPSPQSDVAAQSSTDVATTFETISETKTPQVPLGSLDKEINKGWLARIVSSRNVRNSAERIMTNYDPKTQLLGSGDVEENKRLFDAAIDSYVYHNQPLELAAAVAFLTKNKIASEKLSNQQVLSCLEAQRKFLEDQRKTLQPHVEQAQDLEEKEKKITTVLEILQPK